MGIEPDRCFVANTRNRLRLKEGDKTLADSISSGFQTCKEASSQVRLRIKREELWAMTTVMAKAVLWTWDPGVGTREQGTAQLALG